MSEIQTSSESEQLVHGPTWPPPRPTTTRGEKAALLLLATLTAVVYLSRLGAGSLDLGADAEQCTKWPTYNTERCYELIPLDEIHYVPDARDVLRFGTESDVRVPTPDDGAYVVHPPVGKWFIAAGIALFGDNPVGWRIFNAILGAFGVLILYAVARRLIGSAKWSILAASLLAIDGMWFTMSRIAMLDIAASVFTLLAGWASIEVIARAAEGNPRTRQKILAGIAWGLALSVKWSVGSFALVAGLGMLAAEVRAYRRRQSVALADTQVFRVESIQEWANSVQDSGSRPRLAGRKDFATWALSMTLIPALIYVAVFFPWFTDSNRYVPPLCEGKSVATSWACYQKEQLSFHRNLAKYKVETSEDGKSQISKPGHPYFGHAISWAWLGRPVVHAYTTTGEGDEKRATEVMGIPNPIVWWSAFFIAIPWLFTRARRDTAARIVLAAVAAGWVPYLIADLVARPVFMFYATPMVPAVVLATTLWMRRLWGTKPWLARSLVGGLVGGAMILAIWMYPIHAGYPIPFGRDGWNGRILFATDCSTETIKVLCWI